MSVLVVVPISSVPLSMEDEVIEVSWLSDSVSAGNLGQLLVDAAECGVGEFGQLFALGGEVLTEDPL